MSNDPTPLVPQEGWHVMHLFYSIDHGQWNLLSRDEQREAKIRLTELVQEIRSHQDTQLLMFAIATPKADLGFMLLTPDLHDATHFEKRLTLSLGADILTPTYSYLSQTERSEYPTTAEAYGKDTLVAQEGMTEGSPEYLEKIAEFDKRMEHYLQHRLYPDYTGEDFLTSWPAICFYPMSKSRRANPDYNWYQSTFEERAALMKGHAAVGRTYAGKILQLITGSTGLDEYEWGVTLVAKDTFQIKKIVYEMRFDEVTSRFGEFGDFYIGMQLPLDQLFTRVCL